MKEVIQIELTPEECSLIMKFLNSTNVSGLDTMAKTLVLAEKLRKAVSEDGNK